MKRFWALTGSMGDLLACLAGVLLPFSLAPYGVVVLAPLSVLLLLLTVMQPAQWQQLSVWRLTGRYFLYGVGSFGVGVSWVYVSIHDYGYTSVALAIFVTVLWVLGLSMVLALPWWVWHRCVVQRQQKGVMDCGLLAGFAAVWVLNEWVRSWLLTGFPWLYIGYSQTLTWLGGWAPLLGVFGVSLMTVLPVVLLFGALQSPSVKSVSCCVAVTVLALLGGRYCGEHAWTTPQPTATQAVSLIQGNVLQEQKWRPEQRQAIRQLYRNMTEPELVPGQLVVWPEAAIPELYTPAHPFFTEMQTQLQQRGGALIAGVPSLHYDNEGRRMYYNSLLSLGEAQGFYHKRRLVPFGEYVPLQDWVEGLLDFFKLPISDFRRGPAEQTNLSTGSLTVAGSICYEIAYPDLVAEQAGTADFLLTVSNDSWFGHSIGPHQHLQMAQMRARENGRILLRATSNGITAIVQPTGEISASLPQFQPGILHGRVMAYAGQTPFQRTGSWPALLLCVGLFCASVLRAGGQQNNPLR